MISVDFSDPDGGLLPHRYGKRHHLNDLKYHEVLSPLHHASSLSTK